MHVKPLKEEQVRQCKLDLAACVCASCTGVCWSICVHVRVPVNAIDGEGRGL